MLWIYVIVLLGMNPRRNRSTVPSTPYLLGLMMMTRSDVGLRMCHAPEIWNGTVQHEHTAEAFDVTGRAALAWLENDNVKHPVMVDRELNDVKSSVEALMDGERR